MAHVYGLTVAKMKVIRKKRIILYENINGFSQNNTLRKALFIYMKIDSKRLQRKI